MPKKSSRASRRANRGLMIMSLLVVASLALSAVATLAGPLIARATPTPDVIATLLAAPTLPPRPTPTPTLLATPTP